MRADRNDQEAGYVLLAGGQILGQVTTAEARQMVELMEQAGAPAFAEAFAKACGLAPDEVDQ